MNQGSRITAKQSLGPRTWDMGPSAAWSLPGAPAHLLPLSALHSTLSIHGLLVYRVPCTCGPDFCLHGFAHFGL